MCCSMVSRACYLDWHCSSDLRFEMNSSWISSFVWRRVKRWPTGFLVAWADWFSTLLPEVGDWGISVVMGVRWIEAMVFWKSVLLLIGEY